MQLKLQRTQREGGMLSKSVLFCLDARVQFTAEEAANIKRYRLQDQLIYSSEAAKSAAAGSSAAAASAKAGRISLTNPDDILSSAASKMGHGLKAAALGALASMKLTITISSLERGQHIECKNLDELIAAEDAIMDACRSLKGYLEVAATFDGREVLIDFAEGEPAVVASAPAPMLVAPPSSVTLAPANPSGSTGEGLAPPAVVIARPSAPAASTAQDAAGTAHESLGHTLLARFNAMPVEERSALSIMSGAVVMVVLIILAVIF